MHEHCEVEDAEDDVSFPLDVFESGRDEVTEGEIEGPVRGGGECDGFAADAKRVEFGRVDPGDWTPGGGEGGDEQIGTGDDGFGWGPGDGPGSFGGVIYALWARIVTV